MPFDVDKPDKTTGVACNDDKAILEILDLACIIREKRFREDFCERATVCGEMTEIDRTEGLILKLLAELRVGF